MFRIYQEILYFMQFTHEKTFFKGYECKRKTLFFVFDIRIKSAYTVQYLIT